jgi:hypothetical protein
MQEVRGLLDLVDGARYTCGEVQTITLERAVGVRRKIADLRLSMVSFFDGKTPSL